ncbi:hypothetical protein ABI59_03870 [Acidobacteria bacterium Mor1]|nr:hypothetical protein ABI59_03870 [Acidobacteria bacterium Mor1]
MEQREKALKEAERLLKQGRVQAALGKLQQFVAANPGDMPALNRVGDLLARQGRNEEAVDYYEKIAASFSEGGFIPKAIAIYKKVLRLVPDHTESNIRLGELYLRQNLLGDARANLVRAADKLIAEEKFDEAQAVYEKLIAAQPEEPSHRLQLAEALAAAGDTERAAQNFGNVARLYQEQGNQAQADLHFKRAIDVDPNSVDAVIGAASCMRTAGRLDAAIGLLSTRIHAGADDPSLTGELALCHHEAGKLDKAVEVLLESARPADADVFMAVFRAKIDAGEEEPVWQAFDPAIKRWTDDGSAAELVAALERLVNLEDPGHIPALQRLYHVLKAIGDREGSGGALESLVQAYRSRSMHDEASLMLDQLREIRPESPLLAASEAEEMLPEAPAEDEAASEAGEVPEEMADGEAAADAPAAAVATDGLDPSLAAPAVPLSRSDEEFASGRMTQAEILEKYGLIDQARDQLLQVTTRFPGYVEAQDRLVKLMRLQGAGAELIPVLTEYAIAQKAAGDSAAAKAAVEEARGHGTIPDAERAKLELLGLLSAEPKPAPAAAKAGKASKKAAAKSPKAKAKAKAKADADELIIDFASFEEDEPEIGAEAEPAAEVAAPEPAEAPEPAVVAEPAAEAAEPAAREDTSEDSGIRRPDAELLKGIRSMLMQGQLEPAKVQIDALRTLGFEGPELDEIQAGLDAALAALPPAPEPAAPQPAAEPVQPVEQPVEAAPAQPAAPAAEAPVEPAAPAPAAQAPVAASVPEPAMPPGVPEPGLDDDEDLTAITEALEEDLFEEPTVTPQSESDESIEEVFAAFRQHVQEEVGEDDHRTHYDLGIAYKEMGLINEAIDEFQIAVNSPDLLREACSMLALCHREKQDLEGAVRWYRDALRAAEGDAEATRSLNYDLGEVLEMSGEAGGALDLFRAVLAMDPDYRDVQDKVRALEGSA